MTERPYHYVIVRTDLTLPQQLVQAAHASYEAGAAHGTPGWNGNMVMCQVASEEQLEELAQYMETEGIPHVVWREGDLNDQITSIATAPLQQEKRRLLQRLDLWRP